MRRNSVRTVLFLAPAALGIACASDSGGPGPASPAPLVATSLSFLAQPANAVKDTALPSSIQVAVRDQNGATLTTAATSVSLALGTNPSGATLVGTATQNTVSGVATFTGLTLNKTGVAYTLIATASGLTGATSAPFTVTLSLADGDHDGFSPNSGDCNDGSAAIRPGADDFPDAAFIDTNCDTIDGDTAKAVFVAGSGSAGGTCGTMTDPCSTPAIGIARAASRGRRDVYIAAGTYTGAVTLVDGVSLYGAFGIAWDRNFTHVTTFTGASSVNVGGSTEAVVIYAVDLTLPTVVADLQLDGPNAIGQGKGAYGIVVRNVGAGVLTITRNTILVGNGSAGAPGNNGTNAATTAVTASMVGVGGGDGHDLITTCNTSTRGAGGGPGTNSALIGSNPNGGTGGNGGTIDTDCDVFNINFTATAGVAGTNAAVNSPGFGTGGASGSGAGSCSTPQNGLDGRVLNGAAGTGASTAGLLIGDFWVGKDGNSGALGDNGGGGGGGGGSGGCDNGTDSYGAGGGGGGAGGVRAPGSATGGHGGGGAFGIYLVNALPLISANTISRGAAGAGGAGGVGGQGQSGGDGGTGGAGTGDSPGGGHGGRGAHGGHGGGGGGGGGGISAAFYASSPASALNLVGNTISGGSVGMGGPGGLSAPSAPAAERNGNAGNTGASGSLLSQGTCVSAGGC